jgi:hypothetical protein
MSKNISANAANAASTSKITKYIHQSYNAYDTNVVFTTDKINVGFTLSFGKGNDSAVYKYESDLKQIIKSYDIESIETEDTESYYVIADEGPIVIKIENLDIYSRYNNNCDYALGFAVDFDEPEYFEDSNITPFNIDRDGVMWSIPVQESSRPNNGNVFYQNGKAKYQWTTSRAKAMGEELTEDEKELGVEKTSETTGMMYLTFMVLSKEKEVAQEQEITRSATRSISRGATRGTSGGATRGIGDSVAGRVGYGNSASTSSVASTFKHAKNTSRLVIPVRFRISKDSGVSDINCSKTLRGAEINMERKKIVAAPFLP